MNIRRDVLKALRRLAWLTGILAAFAVIVWLALDIAAGVTLRRSIAAWQEAGLTMNVRDFVPPDVPPEENAAVILSRVIEFRYSPPSDHRLRERGVDETITSTHVLANEILSKMERSQASSEEVAALETVLTNPEIVYRLHVVREALQYDRFDAYLKYEHGYDLLIPYVGGLRTLARLLCAEAVGHASRDKWPEAFDSLAVSLQLGDLQSAEPLVISQLTRRAIRTMTLEHLEAFLRIYPAETEALDRLMDVVYALQPINLKESLIFDSIGSVPWFIEQLENRTFHPSELFGIEHTNREWEWLFVGLGFKVWIDKGVGRPIHKADIARLIDTHREQIELLRAIGENEIGLEALREWEEHRETELPWYAVVTRSILSSGLGLLQAEKAADAHLTLARTGLAAHAYRLAEGDWPETIDRLVPGYLSEVPRDPFDNEPLRYHRNDGRVILYSIGPNRTDDGGLRVERPTEKEPGDLVWMLQGDWPGS